jgi:hypothetical protein
MDRERGWKRLHGQVIEYRLIIQRVGMNIDDFAGRKAISIRYLISIRIAREEQL